MKSVRATLGIWFGVDTAKAWRGLAILFATVHLAAAADCGKQGMVHPPEPAIRPPTDIAASCGDGQVALTWSAAAGATAYRVMRAESPSAPSRTSLAEVADTVYLDTGLANGTTYYYVVRSLRGAEESRDSSEVAATPLVSTSAPPAPQGLTLAAGDGELTLTWHPLPAATRYVVRRAGASGGPYAQIGDTGERTYVDRGLTNGATYYYVVRGVNAVGEGPDSLEVSGTPAANASPATTIYDEEMLGKAAQYTTADFDRVRQAYIFFGHQSVGTNILDGLTSLQASETRYAVTQRYLYNDFRAYAGNPALGHRNIGTNTQPDSKITAFVQLMRSGESAGNHLGGKVQIAFMKFCFVDIDANTNLAQLFEAYRSALEALEADYPQTQIVYTTVPLGLGTGIDVRRNAFNDLVRSHCRTQGKRLFDVAAVEATKGAGERCTFSSGGVTYDRLCQEYSAGDPHLNATGGRRVAEVMMLMFADLLRS